MQTQISKQQLSPAQRSLRSDLVEKNKPSKVGLFLCFNYGKKPLAHARMAYAFSMLTHLSPVACAVVFCLSKNGFC
jgi:hypothetical protein